MNLLHHAQHWIHQQPVSHIAWASTAIAVAVALLIVLPRAFRRLTVRGDRGTWRVALLLVLVGVGIAIEVSLDRGYRTHVDAALAYEPATQDAQILDASRPFQIDAYYTLQQRIERDSRIGGALPEINVPASWTDLRSKVPFGASIVGLPGDLGAALVLHRPRSPALQTMLENWQTALNHLQPGHVYVDATLARSAGIQAGDILSTTVRGQRWFPTVSGALPDGQLAGRGPAVMLPLSTVQTQFGLTDQISRIEVVVTSRNASDTRLVRRYILRNAGSIPTSTLSSTTWAYPVRIRTKKSGDANRWLALGAGVLVVFAALILGVLGRRSKVVGGRRKKVGAESVRSR